MNSSIGGYFEYNVPKNKNDIHSRSLKLNTGRNCFEYILLVYKIKKIWIPLFTCDAIIEPLIRHKISYFFYTVNENLEIDDISSIPDEEWILITNFYGLKSNYIKQITGKRNNLIVDNAQAFFEMPIKGVPTFYSPRKFFGLPDGGILYCDKKLDVRFENDSSIERLDHLFIRLEKSAEEGFEVFKRNENLLKGQPIRKMSLVTLNIYYTVDMISVKEKRRNNFEIIHTELGSTNELSKSFNYSKDSVPLLYPYLNSSLNALQLREKLRLNKIYLPIYWPNVIEWSDVSSIEYSFSNNILNIPIDQRYGFEEMNKILNIIKNNG